MQKFRFIYTVFLSFLFYMTASAQVIQQGVISYETKAQAKIGVSGNGFSQPMTLDMVASFNGNDYKIKASMREMSGINMSRYYVDTDKTIYNLNTIGDKQYAIVAVQTVSDVVKTGNTKEILGYPCTEFTCTFDGNKVTGWYTEKLPATISPFGGLGLPGALISWSSAVYEAKAVDIKTNVPVTKEEIALPKSAIKVTDAAFRKIISNG